MSRSRLWRSGKTILICLLVGFALGILLGVGYCSRTDHERERTSGIYETVVSDIRDVLRVTVMESEEMVPVEYSRGHIHAFGIGSYRVRIYFDVEQMAAVQSGDTLFVRLPQPEVSVLESETHGFTLLDVWSHHLGTNLLGPQLTTEDENAMRRQAAEEARQRVMSAESLSRARSDAAALVAEMLTLVPGEVVVYTSPFDALPGDPDQVLLPAKD